MSNGDLVVAQAFQHRADPALPVAAFAAWQGLMKAAARADCLAGKARLLTQPLLHALATPDSSPDILQVHFYCPSCV